MFEQKCFNKTFFPFEFYDKYFLNKFIKMRVLSRYVLFKRVFYILTLFYENKCDCVIQIIYYKYNLALTGKFEKKKFDINCLLLLFVTYKKNNILKVFENVF